MTTCAFIIVQMASISSETRMIEKDFTKFMVMWWVRNHHSLESLSGPDYEGEGGLILTHPYTSSGHFGQYKMRQKS